MAYAEEVVKMILSSFQVLPPGKGSLYNRLFLMGTEVVLGLAPAPEYTFLAYLCFSCWKLLQGCSSLTSGYLVIVDMTLDLVTGNHYHRQLLTQGGALSNTCHWENRPTHSGGLSTVTCQRGGETRCRPRKGKLKETSPSRHQDGREQLATTTPHHREPDHQIHDERDRSKPHTLKTE
ncbi:hypothetical protein YC2023_018970 [Brassica napus]